MAVHVVRLDDSGTWMPKLIALAKVVAGRAPKIDGQSAATSSPIGHATPVAVWQS